MFRHGQQVHIGSAGKGSNYRLEITRSKFYPSGLIKFCDFINIQIYIHCTHYIHSDILILIGVLLEQDKSELKS